MMRKQALQTRYTPQCNMASIIKVFLVNCFTSNVTYIMIYKLLNMRALISRSKIYSKVCISWCNIFAGIGTYKSQKDVNQQKLVSFYFTVICKRLVSTLLNAFILYHLYPLTREKRW